MVPSVFLGHRCNVCDRKFSSLGHLSSHKKFIHDHPNGRRCPVCTRRFRTPQSCVNHISKAHPDHVTDATPNMDSEGPDKHGPKSPTALVDTENLTTPTKPSDIPIDNLLPSQIKKTKESNSTDILSEVRQFLNIPDKSGAVKVPTDDAGNSFGITSDIPDKSHTVKVTTEACDSSGITSDISDKNPSVKVTTDACDSSGLTSDISQVISDSGMASDDSVIMMDIRETSPIDVSDDSSVEDEEQKKITILTCGFCGPLKRRAMMLNHYAQEHGIGLIKELLQFECQKQFFCWKEKVEKETRSIFVKRFSKVEDQTIRNVYRCHRDGHYYLCRDNKRDVPNKPKGCPASIRTIERGGKIEVAFYKTHVGHDCMVERCPPKLVFLTKKGTKIDYLPPHARAKGRFIKAKLSIHHSKTQSQDLLKNCGTSSNKTDQLPIEKKPDFYKSGYHESLDNFKGKVVLKREGFTRGIAKKNTRASMLSKSTRNNAVTRKNDNCFSHETQVTPKSVGKRMKPDMKYDNQLRLAGLKTIIVPNTGSERIASEDDHPQNYLSDHCYSANVQNNESSVGDNNGKMIDKHFSLGPTVGQSSSQVVKIGSPIFVLKDKEKPEERSKTISSSKNLNSSTLIRVNQNLRPENDHGLVMNSCNFELEKWKELQKMVDIIQSIDSVEALIDFRKKVTPLFSD